MLMKDKARLILVRMREAGFNVADPSQVGHWSLEDAIYFVDNYEDLYLKDLMVEAPQVELPCEEIDRYESELERNDDVEDDLENDEWVKAFYMGRDKDDEDEFCCKDFIW